MTGNEAILIWVLAGALVVIGLAGTILPALPGVPLVYFGLLIAAWIGDFQRIGTSDRYRAAQAKAENARYYIGFSPPRRPFTGR